MTTEALHAWIIHSQPQGDGSAYITFFTKEKGIVNANLKSARASSRTRDLIQPFRLIWIFLALKKNNYVNRLENLKSPQLILKGRSLLAAFYLNELIYRCLEPLDPQLDLFINYYESLKQLTQEPLNDRHLSIIILNFELSILTICGIDLRFLLGNSSIEPHKYYQFSREEGFILVNNSLGAFLGSDLLAIAGGNLTEHILQVAQEMVRNSLASILGSKRLKSARFLSLGIL